MSFRTNRAVIALRNMGRVLVVNRWLAGFLASESYEDRFQKALLTSVREGDCVWDVGANIGLYTASFAERVGTSGKVYAFEPSPKNLRRLRAAVSNLGNVTVLPVALGDHQGGAAFLEGEDDLGATSRVLDTENATRQGTVPVELTTGDILVAAAAIPLANVIKIDTEGYELDVLKGMRNCLSASELRMICIEVHFGLLACRGMKDAPAEIERILTASEFHYKWSDASHIVATRN